MSSSRERSQTKKPNGSIPRGGRLLSLIFALSRNPNRLLPRKHKKERLGSSLNSLTLTRGGTSQLFATANGAAGMRATSMGRAARPNERERMSQSVHWRISYLLTVNGSGKRRRPPSRIIGGQRSDSSGKNSKPPSAQFAEWSEWDERPVFATLRRGKHRRSELSTASLR